jgi:hypothetical protein
MRENMRVRDLVLENRAFCTSLFNLVEVKSIPDIVKNQQEVKSTQNGLAKLLIDLARPLAKKLHAPAVSIDVTTVFETYETQLELDFVSFLLGSLNAASEIGDFSKEILKALDTEVLTPMLKGLAKLRQKEVSQRMFINLVLQIFNLCI